MIFWWRMTQQVCVQTEEEARNSMCETRGNTGAMCRLGQLKQAWQYQLGALLCLAAAGCPQSLGPRRQRRGVAVKHTHNSEEACTPQKP